MKPPPPLADEERRLRRLRALDVLDTQAEAVLDAFTELAAAITGMPIALISLIDGDRQWFKSAVGLAQGAQTPRDLSFCGHAIARDDIFEVEDTLADDRFHDNPLVTEAPRVRHYAGAPLVMPGGERIGTICVVGDRPGRLSSAHRELLQRLAQAIVDVLLLRESEHNLGTRLRTEKALRESEAQFRAITEAMPQMVWASRPDGLHDFYNLRWYEFTGMQPGSTLRAPWTGLLHPEDQARATRTWQHSLATGEPYEAQYRLYHHSGDYRWVLARALPVRDDAGHILRWMGTCTDIHDQKMTEVDLEANSRRKDEFLAMLAHELRNPLAPISTAAHILYISPQDPQAVRKCAELISRQVHHITELVDDLLDVSRVTRGLVQIEREPVDLRQVIQAAIEQTRPLMEARRHELASRTCAEPVMVLGDPVRLTQIVANLLNNAAKYTPEGGMVAVTLEAHGGQARLAVQDNGSGMDADLLPRVFELFTQGGRTPDRAQGGLGVGLALARSIARLHGGDVQASSQGRGLGSRFELRLPLASHAQPATEPAQATPPAPAQAPGGMRVMVVDDNRDAAELMGIWLEAHGHRPVVRTDSAQALDTALRDPAQVYVLDIGLPEMDGYELARRLRASSRTQKATLIALTGYGQAQDIARSREAGFDFHFVKPMDPARLAALMAQLAAAA